MRKVVLFSLALTLSVGLWLQAQGGRGKTSVTVKGKKISIDYGRPQLQGRDVMKMAPNGTVWRMGMNEATELDTSATLKFKGLNIKPGKYTLFAKKVSDSDWRLIVNKKTKIWGTDYDASSDLGSTPLTVTALSSPADPFTITLSAKGDDAVLEMTWGNRKLGAKFDVE